MRPFQDFDTCNIDEVEIESAFIQIGNVVDVEAYGGRVDSGTYTPYVGRGNEFGAIIGNKQIGNDGRNILDRTDIHFVEIARVEIRDGTGELEQFRIPFGVTDDSNGIQVIYAVSERIGLPVARNGKVPKMSTSRKFFIRFVYLLKERVSL